MAKRPLDPKVARVLSMCRRGVPAENVRRHLLEAIILHPRCIHPEEPGSLELMRELFHYAKYPLPEGLPETVRLYRGVAGVDEATGLSGYYWTNCRTTAACYAFNRARRRDLCSPIVLTADVPREFISAVTELNDSVAWTEAFDADVPYEFIVLQQVDDAEVHVLTRAEIKKLQDLHLKLIPEYVSDGIFNPERGEEEAKQINTWVDEHIHEAPLWGGLYGGNSWRPIK